MVGELAVFELEDSLTNFIELEFENFCEDFSVLVEAQRHRKVGFFLTIWLKCKDSEDLAISTMIPSEYDMKTTRKEILRAIHITDWFFEIKRKNGQNCLENREK